MKTNLEIRLHSPEDLSQDWYVYVYDTISQKPIKKVYKGLKKATIYEERLSLALKLKKFLQDEISEGWNPSGTKLPTPNDYAFSFLKAYKFAYDNVCTYTTARSTLSQYKTHYNDIIKTIIKLGFQNEKIRDFEPYHISIILEEAQKDKKGSNDYYNKNLKNCKRFFRELCTKFIIKTNPASPLKDKEYKPKDKILLNQEQYNKVFDYFKENNSNYFTFLLFVELGIRPKEARLLKCGDIDDNFIHIRPEVAKTKKYRKVPIPEYIKDRISYYQEFNKEFYFFGTAKYKSKNKELQFYPGPSPIGINVSNMIWRKEVKQKLKIDSNAYHLKHRFANYLRSKGVELEVVSNLFGHSKTEITKIYATEDYDITMRTVSDKLKEVTK